MIKGLDHINIVVSDLESARRFFEAFGMVAVDSSELSGPWISSIVRLPEVSSRYVRMDLPGTDTKVELIAYDHPPSGKSAEIGKANWIGYRHLAFKVSDIELEIRKLKERGVEFLSDVFVYEKIGKKLVYFYGPDGILLELAEYVETA